MRIAQNLRGAALALGLGAFGTLNATPGFAGQAGLVADHVQVVGNGQLVAQGNVVVIYEGTTLTASGITYDKASDSLTIAGPITITRPDGTVLVAEAATLSADLKNGILQSARLVLNEQLQIAAAQINRVNDRYTQMSKVTASSCQVCAKNPVPLWQIRAERVVHDEAEKQLYFHGAQLRVADVPVFYLPRLRLPDPTVKRATGFLAPKLRQSTTLGVGILTPYFLRLGDHADLTLSPFIASNTTTLEWRYRQAFASGDIEFTGAISEDNIIEDTTRYYVFGSGEFDLPADFTLSFEFQESSDAGYLSDYSYSDQDRLRNSVSLMRARRDEFIFAGITRYDTLRDSEIPISDELPFGQIDAFYERRIFPDWMHGSELRANLSWQAHFRESSEDIIGRDMARLGAGVSWHHGWETNFGLVVNAEAGFDANVYVIEEDSRYVSEQSYATPSAGVTLRYPLSRVTRTGMTDILEPVVSLAWSEQVGADVPNEDSVFVEFDEANLFDLSRFPGADRQEEGWRAAAGLKWTRQAPSGWSVGLAAGRVFREYDLGQFSDASGLSGSASDWLLGAHVNLGSRFALQGRALVDDDLDITKSETRAIYQNDKFALGAAHIWVLEDLSEGRADPTHELRLDGAYQISDFWQISADGSFDLQADQATAAGLGVNYTNECLSVEFSLSRRFTSSTNVTPTTEFGLSVEIPGFGGTSSGVAHRCGG